MTHAGLVTALVLAIASCASVHAQEATSASPTLDVPKVEVDQSALPCPPGQVNNTRDFPGKCVPRGAHAGCGANIRL